MSVPVEARVDLSSLEVSLRERVAEEVGRHVEELRSDRWMDSKQAAEYLGCSVGRVWNLRCEGRIPFHREGGRLVFSRVELDDWIRSGRAAA